MYSVVPSTSNKLLPSSISVANPKSINFTTAPGRLEQCTQFSNLISRWTMPFLWQNAMASSICTAMLATSRSANRLTRCILWLRSPPEQYSMRRWTCWSSSTTSSSRQIFGWSSNICIRTSRTTRSRFVFSRLLIATCLPSANRVPRRTVPWDPWPRSTSSSVTTAVRSHLRNRQAAPGRSRQACSNVWVLAFTWVLAELWQAPMGLGRFLCLCVFVCV
mmetsp:Transcript_45406/g.119894  ORF Transcript_45406/g.119894 Transcript_45406/m.119894 type:complete len:219 (-) Transcript_45406:41-697(-)